MIRFGPAGIPLSCKGRTVRDGILYTRALELDAMEVQFVRGIQMTLEEAEKVREAAEATNVELHVKAPYYTNFAGDEKNVERSRQKVLSTGLLANVMGAESVLFHPGFYGELTKDETLDRIIDETRNLRNIFIQQGWKPQLAMEIMGKRNVFGSMEEVLEVCRKVKGVVPVLDWAHVHARGNGQLQEAEDFEEVLDLFRPLKLDNLLMHFTGTLYENGNARYRLPIKKGDLKFEPLCEVLQESKIDATIMSTSPILEHDAMYMNILWDRVKERREAKIAKEIREIEEAEEKQRREEERKRVQDEAKAQKEAEKKAKDAERREAARLAAEADEPIRPDVIQTTSDKRQQVQCAGYKLYKKGERFYFMKAKREGFNAVFKVPDGREVVLNKNGVPTIRKVK